MKMNDHEILGHMKILYVEDDASAREELTDVLKRHAGKLAVAENGFRGLELCDDLDPDIIVTDLYMPEMGGIEMIQKLHKRGNRAAVVVISAVSDVDTMLGAIDAGISKYVLKPVNVQELLEVMADLARGIYDRKKKEESALPENRKRIEDEIRREFSAFLKGVTGKGPRDVNVFLGDDKIELVASDVLTIFEKNLLDNNKNVAIIKYARELFFSVKADDMCSLILNLSGRKVNLSEVIVSAEKDKNKLIFTIDRSGQSSW